MSDADHVGALTAQLGMGDAFERAMRELVNKWRRKANHKTIVDMYMDFEEDDTTVDESPFVADVEERLMALIDDEDLFEEGLRKAIRDLIDEYADQPPTMSNPDLAAPKMDEPDIAPPQVAHGATLMPERASASMTPELHAVVSTEEARPEPSRPQVPQGATLMPEKASASMTPELHAVVSTEEARPEPSRPEVPQGATLMPEKASASMTPELHGGVAKPETSRPIVPEGATLMPEKASASMTPELHGGVAKPETSRPIVPEGATLMPDGGSLIPEGGDARPDGNSIIPEVGSKVDARVGPKKSETWSEEAEHAVRLQPDAAPATATTTAVEARFDDVGLIGVGGMGEVRRVWDRHLNRVVALKAIRPELVWNDRVVSRFVSEAQATAQLQHPCIVPVYEMGRLSDDRLYFTMREVKGRQYGELIHEVHQAKRPGRWEVSETGWTFRRLMTVFLKTCEAIAYAHNRGVIHRDIKPENIMVGQFGEVLVVDWGLARVMDDDSTAGDHDDDKLRFERVVTSRSQDDSKKTMAGRVAGTPSYMPLEQAAGDRSKQGPHSDVYALGAMLYELLCGRPPYDGPTAESVLRKVLMGPPPPPDDSPEIPETLRQICLKAMGRKPEDRYENARALTDALDSWMEGARKREQAMALLGQAQTKAQDIVRLRTRANAVKADATRILADVRPTDPIERKQRAWEREEMASRLEHGAEVLEAVVAQKAHAALAQFPDLPEAHAFLADHYKALHAEAEARGDKAGAEKHRVMLKAHDDGRHGDYLKGDGAVTLYTDPPGAEIDIFRVVEKGRRFITQPFGKTVTTPLEEMSLPMGSYLFVISHPDRITVRYPVEIQRGQHWDGVPPGAHVPHEVYLPEPDEVSPLDQYVPAGWVRVGGDPEAPNGLDADRVWVDGFILRQVQVTNEEYLRFINDLIKQWREDDAMRYAPTSRGSFGDRGEILFLRDKHGNFDLHPDWKPNYPITMVDWGSAHGYASAQAIADGLPWRLPHELEWEKAARGGDHRSYPWGNYLDPTWACMRESHPGGGYPVPVDAFGDDESIYRIRGMGGNVRDWCRNPWLARGPDITSNRLVIGRDPAEGPTRGASYRAVRGGGWGSSYDECRSAARAGLPVDDRAYDLGFRLARPIG